MYQIGRYLHTLVVKNPSAKAGDVRDAGSIPRLGRFPGEGNGNPLQCSNLENPMDRGAWWATVPGVAVGHDWSVLAPVIFKAVVNLRSQDLLRSVVNTEKFLLCYAKSLQSWPILCDPMDCSLPGSSIHGIFQARVPEWDAIAFFTEKFLQRVILWTQHPKSNRLWTLNYLQSCQTPLSQNAHVSLFLNPTFWRQPQDK